MVVWSREGQSRERIPEVGTVMTEEVGVAVRVVVEGERVVVIVRVLVA